MQELAQVERQWLLMRNLSARREGCAVAELAREFQVSEKTVRRDLQHLRQLGFPLEELNEDHGRKRWRLRDAKDVPNLSFDLTEVLSLFLAQRLIEPLEGTYFWDGACSTLRKVRATLSSKALRYFDRLGSMIHDSHQRSSDYRAQGDLIDRLMIGIEDRAFTFITYRSAKSTEPITYDVHPYGLVHHRGSLYLVADSQRHGEFRVFKVDRMTDVVVEPLKFERKAFDLKTYFDSSFGVWHEESAPVRILVRFAAPVSRYIEEHRWSGCERKQRAADGSVICEFRLAGFTEIKSWILGFGPNAVVLEPPELAESIRAEVAAVLSNYAGDAPCEHRSTFLRPIEPATTAMPSPTRI